jgi:hypothetical protein
LSQGSFKKVSPPSELPIPVCFRIARCLEPFILKEKIMSISATSELQAVWRSVVARAWSDDAFKRRLLDNPNDVMREAGLALPDGVNFVVVENEPSRVHLVLPVRPELETSALRASDTGTEGQQLAGGMMIE